MSDLLIQNCQVLQIATDGSCVEILQNQDISIRGNKIEAVQPTGIADSSHFKNSIKADGMLAMPGLINTHAHVPMVLFRGLVEDLGLEQWLNNIWLRETKLTQEDIYWGMLLGLIEMIEAGVTSVADHYFFMDKAAQAVEITGTRALLGWAMFGNQGNEEIEKTAAFVREWQGTANGRIRTIMAPHAPYTCDDDFLRTTARTAQKLGVGIHIHVSETNSQTSTSLKSRGITPIQVLQQTGVLEVPTILAHACGVLPSDIEILSKYTTGIAHAPKTYLKLGMDTAPVTDFRNAGIPVGLATDGAASNNTLDIWESLRLMTLLQKSRHSNPQVLPATEANKIATQESARVFGMGEQLGKLSPRYLADLILIDTNAVHHQPNHNIPANLIYSMQPNDVKTVIVDGKIIMQNRSILTIDKIEVISHVRSCVERLSKTNSGEMSEQL